MQKDPSQPSPRYQGATLIYPPMQTLPSQNATQGQVRPPRPPYYAGQAIQMGHPRGGAPFQQMVSGFVQQTSYVPQAQPVGPVIRSDMMMPSGYATCYSLGAPPPVPSATAPYQYQNPLVPVSVVPGTQPWYMLNPNRPSVLFSQTTQPMNQPPSMQQSQPQASQAPVPHTTAPKKSRGVVIRDPTDNRDITSEIVKSRSTASGRPHGSGSGSMTAEEKEKKESVEQFKRDFAACINTAADDAETHKQLEPPRHGKSRGTEKQKDLETNGSGSPQEHIRKILPKPADLPEPIASTTDVNGQYAKSGPTVDSTQPSVTPSKEVEDTRSTSAQGDPTESSVILEAKVDTLPQASSPSSNEEHVEPLPSSGSNIGSEEKTDDQKGDLIVVMPKDPPVQQFPEKTEESISMSKPQESDIEKREEPDSSAGSYVGAEEAKSDVIVAQSTPIQDAKGVDGADDVVVPDAAKLPVDEDVDRTLKVEDPVDITQDKELIPKGDVVVSSKELSEGVESNEKADSRQDDPTVTSVTEDEEVAKGNDKVGVADASTLMSTEKDDRSAADGEARAMNGHDQINSAGSAFSQVPKKKKGKQRLKEISAKGEKTDQDLMSAYVDKPPKDETSESEETKEEEQEGEPEKLQEEEATWEDKEHEIEKDVDAIVPKVTSTAIISNEDGSVNENTKRQYDRDFLLKFQFSSICTERPKDLPDIEIVLNRAHEPTKPIARSQGSDFTPHYLRQASTGRQAAVGGRGGKGGRSMPIMPKKIIPSSFDNKVTLKKSENAWVRPTVKAESMSEGEKNKDELYRAVRGILNKLTPQKFETLVGKMSALMIDTPEKMEGVIDIIFQKAITEPSFCVAYAKMCKVLASNHQSLPGETKDSSMNFRRILLNKCQKEFEKEKADEKALLAEREKQFDKPEEEKAWLEEIELKEHKQKRRTLGNIRFIGELFKLQMLKEAIMHTCIVTLLKSGDEESTECLCKLLTTIGVDLDHEKAKPMIDQYFSQMEKMTKKNKVSSRLKFMLQDVIELRQNKWVPRREGEGPKTIDQIHEEAKIQQQKVQLALQEDARQRKLQGGRDSPNVRTSVATSDDGWTAVPGKSNRPQQVDPSKLRVTQRTDSESISLGPGGKPGSTWARGASGGLARAAAADEQKQGNRFSALSEQGPRTFDTKGKPLIRGQQAGRRPGGPGSGMSSQRALGRDSLRDSSSRDSSLGGRDEKEKAIAAVRELSTRQSRTPSPSVRLDESRGSRPSSGPRTPTESPAPTPTPPNLEALKEKIRKEARQTVDEFVHIGDTNEVAQSIEELNASQYLHVFVSEAINHVLEAKGEARKKVGKLFHDLIGMNCITVDTVVKGLKDILEDAEELATDIPYIWMYIGEIVGNLVYDGTVPLSKLKECVEPLIAGNKAGKLMAEILSMAVRISSQKQIAEQWHSSGLTWKSLLRPGEDVAQFIEDKKLSFIDKFKTQTPHASQIQEELRTRLKANQMGSSNQDIINWIEDCVPESERGEPQFIRCLTTAICEHCIQKDESKVIFDRETFEKNSLLLLKFVDQNTDRELQVLFAVQKLFTDLGQPTDVLSEIFDALYREEIVCEDTVYKWEASDQEPHGKRAALSQFKSFLDWLKILEEEKGQNS